MFGFQSRPGEAGTDGDPRENASGLPGRLRPELPERKGSVPTRRPGHSVGLCPACAAPGPSAGGLGMGWLRVCPSLHKTTRLLQPLVLNGSFGKNTEWPVAGGRPTKAARGVPGTPAAVGSCCGSLRPPPVAQGARASARAGRRGRKVCSPDLRPVSGEGGPSSRPRRTAAPASLLRTRRTASNPDDRARVRRLARGLEGCV